MNVAIPKFHGDVSRKHKQNVAEPTRGWLNETSANHINLILRFWKRSKTI